MTEYVVLVGVAIVAGVLNAIAGGGSFISLPALLFYGVAPITANATSAASLLPGYVGSLFGFRRDVAPPPALGVKGVALIALVGGVSCALLLLASGDQAFSAVVPWLMLFATVVFAFSPQIKRLSRGRHWPLPLVVGALFATCVYGGYFNGGAGIVIIALLGLQGPVAVSCERRVGVLKSSQARRESPVVAGHDQDLQRRLGRFEAQPFGTRAVLRQYSVAARLRRMTTRHLLTPRLAAKQPLARSRTKRQRALGDVPLLASVATKSLFSVVMGGVSVATYAAFGLIHWPLALLMAVGAAARGVLGARLSYRLPSWLHRSGIVVIGGFMTVVMFNR